MLCDLTLLASKIKADINTFAMPNMFLPSIWELISTQYVNFIRFTEQKNFLRKIPQIFFSHTRVNTNTTEENSHLYIKTDALIIN